MKTELPLTSVLPNPHNPRSDLGDLTPLADSIATVGVLEPILVMEHKGGYMLLDGARRLAASEVANHQTIPVHVVPWRPIGQQVLTMLVCAAGDSLGPMDEARAFSVLRDQGVSQQEIAEQTLYSQPHVSRRLRLMELPSSVQKQVASGEVTPAKALASLAPKRVLPLSPWDQLITSLPEDAATSLNAVRSHVEFGLADLIGGNLTVAAEELLAASRLLEPICDRNTVVPIRPTEGSGSPSSDPLEATAISGSDPVTKMADAILAAQQEPVVVTIDPPSGMFGTRETRCVPCGITIVKAGSTDYAVTKAERHLDEAHGGTGEIVDRTELA